MKTIFTTSKGKIEDTIASTGKYKSSDETFLIDYDLMLNNLSKLTAEITLHFCSKSLWLSVPKDEVKILIMVALL